MHLVRVTLMIAIWWGLLPIGIAAQNGCDENVRLDDVPRAFAKLPQQARAIEFRRGDTRLPPGGHFQGIQTRFDAERNRQICFVTRDSSTVALLLTIEFPLDATGDPTSMGDITHRQRLPSDGRQPPLRHAGGTQLIGNTLVIGVEDNQKRLRSQIQFWDVSQPRAPVEREHLTVFRESVTREDMTAGAVGIVRRQSDHLLVVANWDCRALDFYVSNGLPLGDDRCRFAFNTRWSHEAADKNDWKPDPVWGAYQGIALFADRAARLYLLSCTTDAANQDLIDLFSVDLTKHASLSVRKIATQRMALQGGAHFRNAGGFFVNSARTLVSYSIERDVHETMTVNVSP